MEKHVTTDNASEAAHASLLEGSCELYGDGIHDDAPALQKMLDERGIVSIDRPGTYLIGRTLIIHSNTRLVVSPGARLLAAPLSKCALIENEHFAGGGRDENIEIVGGIWDGNCDMMGLDASYESAHRLDDPYDPKLFKGKLIRFARVDRLVLMRMTVCDPVSYGVQIADAFGFVVRDIVFDYNCHFGTADGIHINGPASDGVIENLSGTTNDDLVSLTAYDESHAEVTLGHIENIYIHNLCGHNGYSGIRLLSGEGYHLKGIRIDGLCGTFRHHAIVIGNHNARPGSYWYDDVVIENVYCSKADAPLTDPKCHLKWEGGFNRNPYFYFERDSVFGNLTIRNVHRHQKFTTDAPMFKFDSTCSFDRLVLDNVTQTVPEGVTAPLWQDKGATFKQLIERDSITETVEK